MYGEVKMDFNTIDWNEMWQEASGRVNSDHKSQKDVWNQRAESFSSRITRVIDGKEGLDKDDYISKMLDRIEVNPEWSVLDIGCGPGTLTLPLAKKAKSVTALDFSSEMIRILTINADKSGIANINYVTSSWQDAFVGKKLGEYDVVVASRALVTGDIESAMSDINSMTRQAAYVTFPVIHLPLDWEAYKAIGRSGNKHPPYIYVYNMLYRMGIMANVEILHSKVKVQFPSIEETIKDLQWRTDPFTADEKKKLTEFLEKKFSGQKNSAVFTHEGRSVWALIWWRKQEEITV
jgi:SAM-dependent methyltransferase